MFRNPEKFGPQVFYFVCLLTMLMAQVVAMSRAGCFLLIVGFSLLWFCYLRAPVRGSGDDGDVIGFPKLAWLLPLLFALTLLALLLVFVGPRGHQLAFSRIEYGLAHGYDEVRAILSQVSWQMFRDYPLLGVGFGCWAVGISAYLPPRLGAWTVDHAHNEYLELAAEVGLIGILPLCLLVLLVGRLTLKAWQTELIAPQRIIYIGQLLAILLPMLHALVDFPFRIPALTLILVVLVALHIRVSEQVLNP